MGPGDDPEDLGNTVTLLETAAQAGELGLEDDRLPAQLQIVVIGNGTFASYPLPERASLTIGRSKACEIPIDDDSISRRHAMLKIGDGLAIEDLGSVNGTRVRGNKLKVGHAARISVGELIEMGKVSLLLQQRSRSLRPRRLWTHDYFEARLEEECARVTRSGAEFAILHLRSDARAAESYVEEALSELIRESDIVGKYGPHQYEVLLPYTPPSKAEEAVQRIESKLLERGLKCAINLACCPRDGRTPHQLLARLQAPAAPMRSIPAGNIVVTDPQMLSLHQMVEQIADSQIGVLLLGETGVGKEVFARSLHRASPRARGPFVEINCAALTETLLESELFGHEKGAFTHATSTKEGLIEAAHGGTLFLDEIAEMPVATQAKLLRVIEDRHIRRVGALKTRPIDVRFVAATNADLERQMAAGKFRSDLYFRLNGISFVIPPLRERLGELEALANAFVAHASQRGLGPHPRLTREALELMRAYSWPGNVRELKNIIERAVLLSGGQPIRPEHLPVEKMRAILMSSPAGSREQSLAIGAPQLVRRGSPEELQRIVHALDKTGGNQTEAARMLGISRRTLLTRLDHFKLDRPRKHKGSKSASE